MNSNFNKNIIKIFLFRTNYVRGKIIKNNFFKVYIKRLIKIKIRYIIIEWNY